MKDDEPPNIDDYLPDAATVARAQDSSAADAAAEKLRADEELRAIVQAQREAELAPPPPAPPSTAQVHLEDVRPNPVPGRLTKPRAYLNLASPDLKRGAPTVKVERAEGAPLDVSADTIPRVERRWPWAVLVGLAVLGAFWLALSLGGPSSAPPSDDADAASQDSTGSTGSSLNPASTITPTPDPSAPAAAPSPTTEVAAHPPTASAPSPPKTAAAAAPQDTGPTAIQRPAETSSPQPNPPQPSPSASGTGMTFDFKKGTHP